MFGKDLGKVWSRFKGVKRTNRQKAEEEKKNKNSPRLWRVNNTFESFILESAKIKSW